LDQTLAWNNAVRDEMTEGGAVRPLDVPDLGGCVGVGVEVNYGQVWHDPRNGGDVGVGDRVIASQHHRDRSGLANRCDRVPQRLEAGGAVAREHRRVTVVHDREVCEGVDAEIHVPGSRLSTTVYRQPDLSGAEAGAGPVRDHVVEWRSHDGDVGDGQLGYIED
jgi:hypothetical protein